MQEILQQHQVLGMAAVVCLNTEKQLLGMVLLTTPALEAVVEETAIQADEVMIVVVQATLVTFALFIQQILQTHLHTLRHLFTTTRQHMKYHIT